MIRAVIDECNAGQGLTPRRLARPIGSLDVENKQIALVLEEIYQLLKLAGEDRFKLLAYERAARTVEAHPEPIAEMARAGRLKEIRGIGDALMKKITELVDTGRMAFHQRLLAETPIGLTEMLRVPGLGPKKVRLLYDERGVTDLAALERAIASGGLQGLKGFGPKTLANIQAGIERIRTMDARVPLGSALPLAERLATLVGELPDVAACAVAGSVRRRVELVKDIDLLIASEAPARVAAALTELPLIRSVEAAGDTLIRVTLTGGLGADLRIVAPAAFGSALHHFTGSKAHNIRLREAAKADGRSISEYGIETDGETTPYADETAHFAALGLAFVPPELREDRGEIEAAREGRLPALVEATQIQGTFHCHTTWSDGLASVREMAEAARELGWSYLGIADHSQTSSYAGGLTPARLAEQLEEIDALNAEWDDFVVLKGSEVDILPDGELDFDDDLLARLDYVVASVHSHFTMPADEMTARVLRAIRHPAVDFIGHPTGRLLARRPGYAIDLDALIDAAAQTGTSFEINCSPRRMELDWIHCRKAAAKGIAISIHPDAHQPSALRNVIDLGIGVARRGWLTADQVLNTRPWDEVKAILDRKRG